MTRVALVGAGYVAFRHLKALADLPFVKVAAIADPDQEKANELASRFSIPQVFASSTEMIAAVKPDVVHILTPPATHARLAIEALDADCHVLVEKPMADTVADCERMIARAKEKNLMLSVNHSARFEPPVLEALELVRKGVCGKVLSVHHVRGSDYPAYPGGKLSAVYRQGSYPFRDLGVHALYLMEAFAGPLEQLNVEQWGTGRDPLLRFDEWRMSGRSATASATALLSWNMGPIENALWIHGEKATLHVDCFLQSCEVHKVFPGPKQLNAVVNAFRHSLGRLKHIPKYLFRVATGKAKPSPGIYNYVQAFHHALHEDRPAPVSPEEGLRTVAWVSAHCGKADEIREQEETERQNAPVTPARVLVTGASGFLGTALLKRLLAEGERPRLLLRRPLPASHPGADLPAVYGDLGEPDAVDKAVAGVEIIYHVGAGMKGGFEAATVWGTRNIIDSCLRHRVARLVYVSSMGILDHAGHKSGEPVVEESALEPYPERRGAYSGTKLKAEGLVRDAIAAQGLPAVILRPGQIFGPGPELNAPNGALSLAGRWVMAGLGGRQLPLVYVDDVVDGMIAASKSPAAVGQVIHLIDPAPLNQNEYIESCLKKYPNLKVLRIPVWLFLSAGLCFDVLGKVLKRDLPLSSYRIRSLRPLSPADVSKAAKILGWKPAVGTRQGLQRTFEE